MDFWSIIGRACLDETFLTQLQRRAEPGQMDTSKLNELWQYLCDERYRFTLWELGEINRVLSQLGHVDAVHPVTLFRQRILTLWADPAPSREAHAVLGLSCIDKRFREAAAERTHQLQTAADPGAAWQAASLLPKFQLTSHDVVQFAGIFNDPLLRQLLYRIYQLIWIVPGFSGETSSICAGAAVPGDGTPICYNHMPVTLIERVPPDDLMEFFAKRGLILLPVTVA